MLWKSEVRVNIQSFNKKTYRHGCGGSVWQKVEIYWFYGEPNESKRGVAWELFRRLSLLSDELWLCASDYNEVIFEFEYSSARQRSVSNMQQFGAVFEECGLIDLDFQGSVMTWENKCDQGANVQSAGQSMCHKEVERSFPEHVGGST